MTIHSIDKTIQTEISKWIKSDMYEPLKKAFVDGGFSIDNFLKFEKKEWLDKDIKAYNFLSKYQSPYFADLSDTTKKNLFGAIHQTVEEGGTAYDLWTKIENNPGFTPVRANVIWRTELARAFDHGSKERMKDLGVKYAYISAAPGCCEQCAELDGKIMPLSELPYLPIHPNCLLRNTKVVTLKGSKNIQDVQIDDYVLTHFGTFERVIDTYEELYSGDFYTLIGEYKGLDYDEQRESNRQGILGLRHYTLRGLTEDHPVVIRRNGKLIDSNAKDVLIGDNVLIESHHCPWCDNLIPFNKAFCSVEHQIKYQSKVLKIDRWKNGRKAIIKKYGSYSKMFKLNPRKVVWKNRDTKIEQSMEAWLKNLGKDYLKQFHVLKDETAGWTPLKQDEKGRWIRSDQSKFVTFKSHYRVDFYIPKEKWFIECDGEAFHKDLEKERKRDIDILTQYPDHKISHVKYGKQIKWETFTLNDLIDPPLLEIPVVEIKKFSLNHVAKNSETVFWRVYNLEVDNAHSFVVGSGHIAVKNCRCVTIPITKGMK